MQKFTLSLALIILTLVSGCGDKNKTAETKDQAIDTNSVAVINDQELNDNIVKLVKVSNLRENILKDLDAYMEQLKKAPGADEATVTNISTKVHAFINSDEYLKNICAAYAKHLNNSDIVALIAFYSTPAGQKWSTESSSIQQEVMTPVMQSLQTIIMGEVQAKSAKTAVPATSKPANHAK